MLLRPTVALLGVCTLLLCAAEHPQPNSENQRDARKLRYSQRQQLTQPEAEAESRAGTVQGSDVADPTAQLNLLPAGTELSLPVDEKPNQAPNTAELGSGITASASLSDGLTNVPSNTAAVRSLALDGTPYGEQRRVVRDQPSTAQPTATKPVLADASGLPTLRGTPKLGVPSGKALTPITPPATELAKATPTKAAAKPVKLPNDKKLVATAPPQKSVPILVKPSKSLVTELPTNLPDRRVEAIESGETIETEDGFKVVPGYLAQNPASGDTSADELRHSTAEGSDAAVGAAIFPDGGETVDPAKLEQVDDSALGSLGVPGQSAPRVGLGKWMLAGLGLLVAGVAVMAVPRQRRRRVGSDELTLIEKIGLGDDREIVVLRKKHYALVLGVTRSATHLLEKVSMASLDSDYHSVINAIIKRETEAPELWRMRPLFSASYAVQHAPEERSVPTRRTSLRELRASLQVVGPSMASSVAAQPASMEQLRERRNVQAVVRPAGQGDRAAVIRRLREQARRAS